MPRTPRRPPQPPSRRAAGPAAVRRADDGRLHSLYPAADRDLATRGGGHARRRARLLAAAGVVLAAGGFSHRAGDDAASRREPRHHRIADHGAARAPVRQIPALSTMTSSSSFGISQITLQFDL